MHQLSDARQALPRYSVSELNGAIANLLERGFAPRFLLEATVSRPQNKKGHLWLTLTDGDAAIGGVIWASQLQKLAYLPEDGDGVLVVGKLNFWVARASLTVQILDVRPGLTAVLRQFERVKAKLAPEGLFDPARKRPLPALPGRIAVVTSVPSSALADMLRTARERWPATRLLVVPVPVQGAVEARLLLVLQGLAQRARRLELEALVLARGGGSREDLMLFDGEALARCLAAFPLPVVCGLGHEDDVTIADLVADYRAATPTAAVVALLPDRQAALQGLAQRRRQLGERLRLQLQRARERLERQRLVLAEAQPRRLLERQRDWLAQRQRLLQALSPSHWLERGFSLVRDRQGRLLRQAQAVDEGELIQVQLLSGALTARVLSRQLEADGPG
ncbi:MAG: exodeoxyribonuclease VII large subunit [Synechococcaceae cyanobacterium]|nr:exodeoxyribonuclease VII large subunit [Synechococcaceae cyanobacterium]